jgi:hypothetical protein
MPQAKPLGPIPNSQIFRFRAEETRSLAETFAHKETRAMLMRVADDYDRMAERALVNEQSGAAPEQNPTKKE